MGNVPAIRNIRGLCSASKSTQVLFCIIIKKREGNCREDGTVQSTFIAFEYLNNAFYTHLFLCTTG